MAKVTGRVEFSGPFFQRDPSKTVKANIHDMLADLAREAEQDVKGQIAGRAGSMPHYTGHTRDSIRGRVESLSGNKWMLNMVVSPSTTSMGRAEAIRTMAAAASIERRWHPVRRTASAIRRMRAVLSANLARGLE